MPATPERLPLVQNRYTLLEHVGDPIDWHYTWQLRDDVTLSSTCGFCGRSELRLTYEVTRQLQTVWICESCVSRYNISADIDGQASISTAISSYLRNGRLACSPPCGRSATSAKRASSRCRPGAIFTSRNSASFPTRIAAWSGSRCHNSSAGAWLRWDLHRPAPLCGAVPPAGRVAWQSTCPLHACQL